MACCVAPYWRACATLPVKICVASDVEPIQSQGVGVQGIKEVGTCGGAGCARRTWVMHLHGVVLASKVILERPQQPMVPDVCPTLCTDPA
jgi:hypothetical protein